MTTTSTEQVFRFTIDGGATYEVTDWGTPVDHYAVPGVAVLVRGLRTRVTYASAHNDLRITGTLRRHTGLGQGRRGLLTIDTGEGVHTHPGVVVGPITR